MRLSATCTNPQSGRRSETKSEGVVRVGDTCHYEEGLDIRKTIKRTLYYQAQALQSDNWKQIYSSCS